MTKQSVNKETLIFGADPEFFAGYMKDGELYVLPPVVLRTDHGHPYQENGRHPIFLMDGKTMVHEDGAAFEMSTPPSSNWETIWDSLDHAKKVFAESVLSLYGEECDMQLHALPSMKYEVARWLDRGPEFHLSTVFGCDPDEDAYNTKVKCRTLDAKEFPWRYAGGHIHASGLEAIRANPLIAIRSMAITAGLAGIAYSDVPELEKERLFLYGKPGKFRVQNYPDGTTGVEYRTLSTRWTQDKKMAEKVFSWARIGLEKLLRDGAFKSIADAVEKEAVQAITHVDQKSAAQILAFIETKL